MTNTKSNKRITAILIAIVVITLSFIPFVNIKAVTADGFVTASEISPPNNVLFNNKNTGVSSNPDNIPIYACCANFNNQYYGVLFATTNSNYGNSSVTNVNGTTPFHNNVVEVSYSGYTIYVNTNYMNGSSSGLENNYSYAKFNTSYLPVDTIAHNFYDFVINGGSGDGEDTESKTLNYNLPAGNVAYIEIGDGLPNISMMSTVMPVKSAAFSSETGWNSSQRVGFAESLPSSGDNLASFGTQIEWIPNGNTNIFGQTQNAKFTAPSLSGHKYLVVVNPLYYAIQYTNGEGIASTEPGVNSTVNNNSVNIFMNFSKGITVYQLTQNVTINNNIPTYSNDVSSGPYEGDIDPDTGDVTWTDPDGGSSQPTTGGGNVPGTGENNFSSFLSGVANRIVNVFQPAHDAILTLSNAVQNIAGWMYALYVWLPAPVLSILTSAISLAIIIGLIKVFV